jgi:hypothetical protein
MQFYTRPPQRANVQMSPVHSDDKRANLAGRYSSTDFAEKNHDRQRKWQHVANTRAAQRLSAYLLRLLLFRLKNQTQTRIN